MKRQLILISFALCLMLCSCTQPETTDSPVIPPDASTLRPLLMGSASMGSITTRAEGDNKPLTGATDRIGIFQQANPTNGYPTVINRAYTYGTPYWTTTEPLLLGAAPATLAAYYPYADEVTTPTFLYSQPYAQEKEFYYCPFAASNSSGVLTLDLRRAYALIRFVFVVAPGYDGLKMTISSFSFTAPVRPAGALNLFTGVVSGSATGITLIHPVAAPALVGEAPAADFLMVPTVLPASPADITFEATVDGKVKQGKLTAVDLCGSNPKLIEGTKYEVTVQVSPSGLEVSDIRSERWQVTDIEDELENE